MLTKVLRISNHPLNQYSENIRLSYLRGLGVVLHKISDGHPNMEMIFEQWSQSILQQYNPDWFWSEDERYIKKALALHRSGVRFYRLKHQFYYDCFYLTELFDKSLLDNLNDFLVHSGCNIFTKAALKQTFVFFNCETDSVPKVEDSLLQHRKNNLDFSGKNENRILVVATVSAGKSTLINALTGHYFNRVKNGVCTTRICKIHNKPLADGITIRNGDLYGYDNNVDYHTSDESEAVGIHFESELGSYRVCLLDTPGVNNSRDEEHLHITSDVIKADNYDLIIFISNCQYNGTNDERQLLNLIHSRTNKPVIFVLNQLDYFKRGEDNIGVMLKNYRDELNSIGFSSQCVLPLSAKYAYYLKSLDALDDEERDELVRLRRLFNIEDYDLQRYSGNSSKSELEKSGIVALEKSIIQFLK